MLRIVKNYLTDFSENLILNFYKRTHKTENNRKNIFKKLSNKTHTFNFMLPNFIYLKKTYP